MTPWDKFFREKTIKIFQDKNEIIDIGGGLRVLKNKGSRYDKNREWILPYLEKADYKILDVVDTYNPDIIGDIHKLPFPDNSVPAIFCLAVLQHVENPILASQELYRVLKPGGYCMVYVPFLYYYHASKGYYNDYWRFSEDAVDYLFKNFSVLEKQAVRGAAETWLKISPLGRVEILNKIANKIDRLTGKIKSHQVSGFHIFLVK